MWAIFMCNEGMAEDKVYARREVAEEVCKMKQEAADRDLYQDRFEYYVKALLIIS